jgi:hypothetical protein
MKALSRLSLFLVVTTLRVVRPERGRNETYPGLICNCVTEPTVASIARGLISVCREPVSSARLGYAPGAKRPYGAGPNDFERPFTWTLAA